MMTKTKKRGLWLLLASSSLVLVACSAAKKIEGPVQPDATHMESTALETDAPASMAADRQTPVAPVGSNESIEDAPYSWQGKVRAIFLSEQKGEMAFIHTDYIDGYQEGMPVSVPDGLKAAEKMSNANYQMGTDALTRMGYPHKVSFMKALEQNEELEVGVDDAGNLIVLNENESIHTREAREQIAAVETEAMLYQEEENVARERLLFDEELATVAPDGSLVFVPAIKRVIPDYTYGQHVTAEQWAQIQRDRSH